MQVVPERRAEVEERHAVRALFIEPVGECTHGFVCDFGVVGSSPLYAESLWLVLFGQAEVGTKRGEPHDPRIHGASARRGHPDPRLDAHVELRDPRFAGTDIVQYLVPDPGLNVQARQMAVLPIPRYNRAHDRICLLASAHGLLDSREVLGHEFGQQRRAETMTLCKHNNRIKHFQRVRGW